ncbi:MAG: 4Fe-4S binding protein [Firmicutes bacterium]|nr:4Fe-4S binding protein [Bacillota bacterium]
MAVKITPECIGCEACIDSCPTNAIIMKEGVAEIVAPDCIECGACIPTCPVNAIVE